MRLDVWLSKVCLLKTRSMAKKGCQAGRILVDGEPARESRQLHPGQRVTLPDREVKVLEIPEGNVAKKDAGKYYEEV